MPVLASLWNDIIIRFEINIKIIDECILIIEWFADSPIVCIYDKKGMIVTMYQVETFHLYLSLDIF